MEYPIFIRNRDKGFAIENSTSHENKDVLIFHEQFKSLRAKIDDTLESEGYCTLAVTSAIAEEGKTVTSLNLAMNIASTGRKRVLLVDTDMRKSNLAQGINVAPVPGLSDFLEGSLNVKQILRNSMVSGLQVIPAGSEPKYPPADALSGEKFRSFLQSAKESFNVIILDTPPVLPVADTISLKDQIERFLIVYRAGFTPYPMLKQAIGEIGEQKILGVVINRVKPMADKYYRQYYGRYYRK